MFDFIKKKLDKKKIKNTFSEYGYEIKKFELEGLGKVEYAQWLHPFEQPKQILLSDIEFYRSLSNEGAMIIDIGAHTGDTTVPMALAVGKDGIVLGLEPNKYVYKILEKNATLNKDKTNIIPLCLAATDKEGKFTFNYSDASFCNGGFLSEIESNRHHHDFTLEVTGVNLQDYLLKNYADKLDKLALIKIDAEGYDKEILKTIPKILLDYKPNLMVECYKRLTTEERNELYDVISGAGYNLYYQDEFKNSGQLKKIEKSNMSDQKHFDILALHNTKTAL